jgi:hypothetical protein
MKDHGLTLKSCRPAWMNFGFIDRCYEVAEHIYDPDVLRELVESRVRALSIPFEQKAFTEEMRSDYDFVVWATYGRGPSRRVFKIAKFQVAEKMLIELPEALQHVALVVVDGPFTAFDPYGSSNRSLFGSARNTNHWTTTDPDEPVPQPYAAILDEPKFRPVRLRASKRCARIAVNPCPARKMLFISGRALPFASSKTIPNTIAASSTSRKARPARFTFSPEKW